MIVDDLDRHLPEAGSIERALVPLAMYLAWCGNLHLFAVAFVETHEQALLRLRYREITPGEFLTATTGGTLDSADLNEQGRTFTETHYPDYLADLRSQFGDGLYAIGDDWAHYDEIAGPLTRRFMSATEAGDSKRPRRHNSPRRGKWWQVWR